MIMQIFAELTDALMVLEKDKGMQLISDLLNVIKEHKKAASGTPTTSTS
jgi:hypothetical protein